MWLEFLQKPLLIPLWMRSIKLYMGAFIYDVRCFLGIFDLPTYPNQMVYYIGLFSKIRCSLTYLPTQKSDSIYECSLRGVFQPWGWRNFHTWQSAHSEILYFDILCQVQLFMALFIDLLPFYSQLDSAKLCCLIEVTLFSM